MRSPEFVVPLFAGGRREEEDELRPVPRGSLEEAGGAGEQPKAWVDARGSPE